MDVMSSDYKSIVEPMSTDMLEEIRDRSQYHLNINSRDAGYNIRYCFKQRRAEWKVALLYTQNMVKGLHMVFKDVFDELSEELPIFGYQTQKFLTSFHNLETLQK